MNPILREYLNWQRRQRMLRKKNVNGKLNKASQKKMYINNEEGD